MDEAPELRELALRWYEVAFAETFDQAALEALLSDRAETVVVGAAGDSWSYGRDEVAQAMAAQFGGARGVSVDEHQQLRAYRDGPIGWSVERLTSTMSDGRRVDVRVTNVFVSEDDGWRIVHRHVSIGSDPHEARPAGSSAA